MPLALTSGLWGIEIIKELDDPNKYVALFMFSPRIKRIKYATT